LTCGGLISFRDSSCGLVKGFIASYDITILIVLRCGV